MRGRPRGEKRGK
uniref:Uncharacterized protein n=1 Tax=Arundo donax TaxID=35708 RepID=A0A0A9BBR3_ARUDO